MHETIFSMIRNARERFGPRPFAFQKTDSGWKSKTFDQIFDEARGFAVFLLSRGYSAGDRVAIIAEGSPNWIALEYGTIMAGCVAVPLSFKLLPEEISYRLEHSEARAVLTNANHFAKLAAIAKTLRYGVHVPDLVSMDEDHDPAALGIDYPAERTFRYAQIQAEGDALYPNFRHMLEKIESECSVDDIVTISYTSGTTGNPKGIMLSHGNYQSNSRDAVDFFDIPQGGFRNFVVLPVDHSFAQTVGIHASVQRGIEVWFVDSRGGGRALLRNIPGNMKEAEPVFMMTVPALAGNFMKKIRAEMDRRGGAAKVLFDLGIQTGIEHLGDGRNPPRTLKAFWCGLLYRPLKRIVLDRVRKEVFGARARFFTGGGAAFDLGQQRFFRALGMPLYQGYGMTEAAPVISSNNAERLKLGTAGVPMPSVEVRILRDDGAFAPAGERGEIVVRGPNVMKGYYRNPEATAEAIVDGGLRTGDLGRLDQDGFLTVEGRAKALLISSDGEKYSPEGIESAVLDSSSLVQQVLVYNDHRKFTCALITLEEAEVRRIAAERKLKTPEALLSAIRDSFYGFRKHPSYRDIVPAQWTPATFQIVEEPFSEKNGLVNSTMKIVRYKVLETYAELIDYVYSAEGAEFDNPRNLDAVRRLLSR
jgi:long-chain acyl-CoA synthetase